MASEKMPKKNEGPGEDTYFIDSDGIKVKVRVLQEKGKFVKSYELDFPEIGEGTRALLQSVKARLISDQHIKAEKILDAKFIPELKERFRKKACEIVSSELGGEADKADTDALVAMLLQEMLGLGKLEILLNDKNIEEIVINSSTEPVRVYHMKHGWLTTNVLVEAEGETQNYASIIARRVGKQITALYPLLDAHLITGDRANATLFPISSHGNTLTIRRFQRDPWTVTDFISEKTVNSEAMALIWIAMQYELNMVVSGGTASGKTSFLNICMPFVQPNHRIVSIEDTRELMLPKFLHWVPMTTREPNPEGKGEVTMLDLLVNSLRMRPDRIIMGEIRRQKEAEVLFEGMHTGHSAYTTVHANTAEETINRLTNPPVSIPKSMLESVHLNAVMFRNRRSGKRRMLELAEFVPEKRGEGEESVRANTLFRWKQATDQIARHSESIRLMDELGLHTGFSQKEILGDLAEKQKILEWMVKQKIRDVNEVGKLMVRYYSEPSEIIEMARRGKSFGE